MVAVAMMQSAVDQIIKVIAMRHGWMPATVMTATASNRRAFRRVGRADFDDVFVVMIAVPGVQMAVVQVICMAVMNHGQVSTIRVVNMSMIRMRCVSHKFSHR